MPRFSNRIALVTGASSGIGKAAASLLAAQGARVIAVARDEQKLRTAMAEWQDSERHLAFAADLTSDESITNLFSGIRKEFDGLDIGILAAGRHLLRPLAVTKAQHVDEMLRSNLLSALLCTKEFAKLAKRDGAAVVWVSSAAAVIGNAGEALYAAAKGALVSACRSVATELAPRIRVNCVTPGVVDTPMSQAWLSRLTPEQLCAVKARHLLGFGEPHDIAEALLFLASCEARWITGTCLAVDGGLTCH